MTDAEKAQPLKSLEEEFKNLQRKMAQIDMLIGPPGSTAGGDFVHLMVLALERMKIRMDGNKNHGRPHIHIDYGTERHAASYALDSGKRLAGNLRRQYDREVKRVIEKTRPHLLELWQQTQSGIRTDATLLELRSSFESP